MPHIPFFLFDSLALIFLHHPAGGRLTFTNPGSTLTHPFSIHLNSFLFCFCCCASQLFVRRFFTKLKIHKECVQRADWMKQPAHTHRPTHSKKRNKQKMEEKKKPCRLSRTGRKKKIREWKLTLWELCAAEEWFRNIHEINLKTKQMRQCQFG